MSKEKIEKCTNKETISYFSYFNHKLYDNLIYTQYENNFIKHDSHYQSTEEESSSNTSYNSGNSIKNEDKFIPLNLLDLSPKKQSLINQEVSPFSLNSEEDNKNTSPVKDIKPELQKFILPKSLFDSSTKKKVQEETKKNEKSINNSPSNTPTYVNRFNVYSEPFTPKINIFPVILLNNPSLYLNYNKFNQVLTKQNMDCARNEKKKKKKKKEFVEREGDWPCYRCKNLNFAFRDKCNKCQLSKDESEKKFTEVGEELLKLADLSIYNKTKDNIA